MSTKNMRLAKTLRLAKCNVGKDNNHGERFICIALLITARYKKITNAQAAAAEAFILSKLGHCYTVERWLKENVKGFAAARRSGEAFRIEIQAYRHRWLDHLITELEK